MSSLIFQAANKRVMMPHSYFMYHDGTLAMDGTTKTVISNLEFTQKVGKAMLDIYVDSMKLSGKYKNRSRKWLYNYLRTNMDKKEDVFLMAKEAVELGFADSVFNYNWASLTEYTQEEMNRG